jgi:hypothetical protein
MLVRGMHWRQQHTLAGAGAALAAGLGATGAGALAAGLGAGLGVTVGRGKRWVQPGSKGGMRRLRCCGAALRSRPAACGPVEDYATSRMYLQARASQRTCGLGRDLGLGGLRLRLGSLLGVAELETRRLGGRGLGGLGGGGGGRGLAQAQHRREDVVLCVRVCVCL